MYCQRYPRTVKLYIEDERVLLIPWIDHFAGYRVSNGKYFICKYNDLSEIGEKVFEALKFIDESPECTINPNELEALKPNHYGSKYKTWKSFYKNNDCINMVMQENGELHILAEDFGEIILSPNFSAEEIGRTIAPIISKADKISCQRYPRTIEIYWGEGKIFLIPLIYHIEGYSVVADKSYLCEYDDLSKIGEKVFEALKFIEESPECTLTPKELDELKPNHLDSKYKTWDLFYKNNDYCASIRLYDNGKLHIHRNDFREVILSIKSSAEEIGRAVASIIAKVEKICKSSKDEKNKTSSKPKKTSTDEKITLSDTSHLAEDEFYGSGDSKFKISFRINDSFCEFKSHAMEVSMLHVYAPGYNPEFDDDDMREDTVPSVSLLEEEIIFEAVENYKNKGTFDGAKELVPLSGMFHFKAKMPYGEHLMYFYALDMCGGFLNNVGLCIIYPKSYEGTNDEKKLVKLLDEIAESYTEERIG